MLVGKTIGRLRRSWTEILKINLREPWKREVDGTG
jgi:hypothetical protein